MDFISSAASLVVDFIAAGCIRVAVLERQKLIEEAHAQQQEIHSKEGDEAETLPINQIKTARRVSNYKRHRK